MTERVIAARGLDVGYDRKTVVAGVELEALRGQVVCLLGPNGAGKSTILRTLSGLIAPLGGVVEIKGEDIRKIKSSDLSHTLSLVLTGASEPSLMTVYELAAMGRTPYTGFMGKLSARDREIVEESLEAVGASELKSRYFSELSDGEKQKVMIARALVQEPELMILDEPTSHLDIKHKVEVINVLRRLSEEKGITCIISLHDIDLAIKGCGTLLLVNGGKIVAQGLPEDIIKSGTIQALYGISGAEYDELSCSVELAGKDTAEIFVTGGNGSGSGLYRALSRAGYGIVSGVIHENDADHHVAKAICSRVISERAFETISGERFAEAFNFIQSAEYIIDSGFPIGSANSANLELLKRAVGGGKPVFSLRGDGECAKLFGGAAVSCGSIGEVVRLVRAR